MRRLALAVALMFPLALSAGKNLGDYPLQIQVIESHWNRPSRYGPVDGWGRGDIKDGDAINAFDFSYTAGEPFHRTVGDARYLAKWKKGGLRMEMLVGEIGAPDKFQSYDLKTTMRDDVYVRGHDGAIAISQEEYKARAKDKDNDKEKDSDSDKQ
ncbi:MAG: hypothetical protein WCA49_10025 [Candidatus Sulfotelmatobacter sp.]